MVAWGGRGRASSLCFRLARHQVAEAEEEEEDKEAVGGRARGIDI